MHHTQNPSLVFVFSMNMYHKYLLLYGAKRDGHSVRPLHLGLINKLEGLGGNDLSACAYQHLISILRAGNQRGQIQPQCGKIEGSAVVGIVIGGVPRSFYHHIAGSIQDPQANAVDPVVAGDCALAQTFFGEIGVVQGSLDFICLAVLERSDGNGNVAAGIQAGKGIFAVYAAGSAKTGHIGDGCALLVGDDVAPSGIESLECLC